MRTNEPIDFYGTQKKAADAIGLKKGSFTTYKKNGGIPYANQCRFELSTKGLLKADRRHDPQNVFYVPLTTAA